MATLKKQQNRPGQYFCWEKKHFHNKAEHEYFDLYVFCSLNYCIICFKWALIFYVFAKITYGLYDMDSTLQVRV